VTTLAVTFPFTSNAQSFTANPAANATLSWIGTDGNPSGSLQSAVTGKNHSNQNSSWTLTTTFTALGVPSGSTITAITAASLDSKCTAFTTGGSQHTSGTATLVDGATTITLSAARSFTAVDASWVTTSGTDATGLSLNASDSITLTINNSLSTGNNNSANMTLLQDNLNFTITYVTFVNLNGQSSVQTKSVQVLLGKTGLQTRASATTGFSSALYTFFTRPLSQLPAVIASIPVAALPTLVSSGGSAVALAASTAVKAVGRVTTKVAAKLSGRASGAAIGKSQPSVKAALSSKGAAVSTAKGTALGKLALAAKATSASIARAAAKGIVPLLGRAFSAARGKPSPSGKVGLAGRSNAISTIRGDFLSAIELIGKGFSRVGLAATAKLAAALNLRSTATATARQAISGKVLLQSAGKAVSAVRGLLDLVTPGQVLLFASSSIQALARGGAKATAALLANSSAAGKSAAVTSGVLHLIGRSASVVVSRTAASTQQVILLLARGFSKATATSLGGHYALTLLARGAASSPAKGNIAGKTLLASLGKAVTNGRSSLVGAAHLAARAASASHSTVSSGATAVLQAAGAVAAKGKAAASYAMALHARAFSSGYASGSAPSMSTVLRALSAAVSASRNHVTAFQGLIQFFARSAAMTFSTLGNRASGIIGRAVTGKTGDAITGAGGTVAVSGTAENNVSGDSGGDNVSGTGGAQPVTGSGP